VPWQQYLFSGDTEPLRENYEGMKRYFAWLETRAAGGPLADGLGDWYDQIPGKPTRAYLTPPALTATAHYYQDAVVLARSADVLGQPEEAADCRRRAEEIRSGFNRAFFRPDSAEIYGSGSHTSLALPLAMGLVEESQRGRVFSALVSDIERRGYATAGAVGYGYLLRALTEGGAAEWVYRLATDPEFPGYAYQLKLGNTALAGSWSAQRGASQNHFFLGQIMEWFYADLAGLAPDPESTGFKRMIVKPHPIPELTWVEASHRSLFGRHAVRWERDGGVFRLEVTVPPNTTAQVYLPANDVGQVNEGSDSAVRRPGVRYLRSEEGRAIFEIGSGVYRFEVKE
ncbi:MAG TPA: alpha-L-rhamnosidase C-terminal domain-containing protein, partial [Opitutus sp.]|nr:alpha-L-rhamnosidase C-terminal domain-containing protein [Opitutus sp.]